MSGKDNWLKEYLQGIDNKVTETGNAVRSIRDTQDIIIKDVQKNWDAYKGLYGNFEDHKLNKCPPIIKHENNEHKGLAGRVFGYVVATITALAIIIAGVWALATYVIK